MIQVYPDYYERFSCIKGNCNHNCCIGWEIDIDEDTAALYKSCTGDFGERLKANIDFSADVPHFILAKDERCPFLNKDNLCDIIIHREENSLCAICSEHPRFHNELPDRVESGLGLCCEEAARIILTNKEKVKLTGNCDCDDEIINLRNKILSIIQDRSLSIKKRVDEILALCGISLPCYSLSEWADIFLSLERLDEKWTDMLYILKAYGDTAVPRIFDEHMKDRQTEYEQLLHYLVYRHLANAPDLYEAGLRAGFAVICYKLVYHIGTALWDKNKKFTTEDQIELCRMLSAEIEYSDENLYILLEELE